MNKKGFTLVELLAVIVVLGLIIAIAVPSINAISIKIKENMQMEEYKEPIFKRIINKILNFIHLR